MERKEPSPRRTCVDQSNPLLGYFVYPSVHMVWLVKQQNIARRLAQRLDRHNPYVGYFHHSMHDPMTQFLADCGMDKNSLAQVNSAGRKKTPCRESARPAP